LLQKKHIICAAMRRNTESVGNNDCACTVNNDRTTVGNNSNLFIVGNVLVKPGYLKKSNKK
jgi:hypothetical protein